MNSANYLDKIAFRNLLQDYLEHRMDLLVADFQTLSHFIQFSPLNEPRLIWSDNILQAPLFNSVTRNINSSFVTSYRLLSSRPILHEVTLSLITRSFSKYNLLNVLFFIILPVLILNTLGRPKACIRLFFSLWNDGWRYIFRITPWKALSRFHGFYRSICSRLVESWERLQN